MIFLTHEINKFVQKKSICHRVFFTHVFLTLDAQLKEEQVGLAMEVAEDSHDADIGFNQEHLLCAIDAVKRP